MLLSIYSWCTMAWTIRTSAYFLALVWWCVLHLTVTIWLQIKVLLDTSMLHCSDLDTGKQRMHFLNEKFHFNHPYLCSLWWYIFLHCLEEQIKEHGLFGWGLQTWVNHLPVQSHEISVWHTITVKRNIYKYYDIQYFSDYLGLFHIINIMYLFYAYIQWLSFFYKDVLKSSHLLLKVP